MNKTTPRVVDVRFSLHRATIDEATAKLLEECTPLFRMDGVTVYGFQAAEGKRGKETTARLVGKRHGAWWHLVPME